MKMLQNAILQPIREHPQQFRTAVPYEVVIFAP